MSESRGRFSYEDLDPVLHERARLGILTALMVNREGLGFGRLQEDCSLTSGNLGRHLATLEEAGLVTLTKSFVNRRSHTLCVITDRGCSKLQQYLSVLHRVIQDAAVSETAERSSDSELQPI